MKYALFGLVVDEPSMVSSLGASAPLPHAKAYFQVANYGENGATNDEILSISQDDEGRVVLSSKPAKKLHATKGELPCHLSSDAEYNAHTIALNRSDGISYPEMVTRGLRVGDLTLSQWHEKSENFNSHYQTVNIPSDAAILELLIEQGDLRACSGFTMEGKVDVDKLGYEHALEELLHVFSEVEGKTKIQALCDLEMGCLVVLDITCLGGIWLTPVTRRLRANLITALIPDGESEVLGPLSSMFHKGIEVADSIWDFDDELGEIAFKDGDKLLTFTLGSVEIGSPHYFWVNPDAHLQCRILSKGVHSLQEHSYGLGMLCPETGEDVYVGSSKSSSDFELDAVVPVEAYLPLERNPEKALFSTPPQILEDWSGDEREQASCLHTKN